jgi:hypothetical protein
MTHGLLSGGFLAGILIGFLAGSAFSVARRAWRDHGIARTAVPKLRRTAFGVTGAAVGWMVVIGVLTIAAVGWAAGSIGNSTPTACATPSPSVSASSRTGAGTAPAKAAAGRPSASPTACR